MAYDLKIEIFAYNLFHELWYTYGSKKTSQLCETPNILEVYEDECSKSDYMEVLDKSFLSVIYVRHSLFKNVYRAHYKDEIAENLKSPIDFFDYVVRICDRDDLFGHLTVFQRMFATITFVLIVGRHMQKNEHVIDIVKYGYIFWVMYFDKFNEEFYEKGSWEKLKIEAKSYENLIEFDDKFNRSMFYIRAIKQSTVSYLRFRNTVDCQEWKHKQSIHISKLWIKFSIGHFESIKKVPLIYEISLNAYDAEFLLEDLKLIFDPSRRISSNVEISKEKYQGSTIPSALSCSERHYTSKVMAANDIKLQPLTFRHEGRIIDKVPDEFPNIDSDFKNRTGDISEQDVSTIDTTNKNENFEFEKNTLTGRELLKHTSSVNSTKILHVKQNLLPVVNRNKRSETSIKKSTNATDSDHICKSNSFVSKCEGSMMDNFCTENIEEQDKIAITHTCQVISTNKMDEKTFPEKVSILKDPSPIHENVSSDDEMEKTPKVLEDLRNERKDPEMKNFLKMLLVLDVNEETNMVLSTLPNKERVIENSQEISKKRKKRSKKKKSTECDIDNL